MQPALPVGNFHLLLLRSNVDPIIVFVTRVSGGDGSIPSET